MRPLRILLAGETWITHSTHIKGVDSFTTSGLESGAGAFIDALTHEDVCEVDHLMGHDVPVSFPDTLEALSAYDVVLLSDIGARSFALHPDTWVRGRPRTDRLALLRDWVQGGGGLGMIGGYLSFQGIDGSAKYASTPVADALPVEMADWDDCVEVPAGTAPEVATGHPLLAGVPADWPVLLGYNRMRPRPDAEVLCTIGEDPLLTLGRYGSGRSLAWASDIGPHWCPEDFCRWEGFRALWHGAVRWLADARPARPVTADAERA